VQFHVRKPPEPPPGPVISPRNLRRLGLRGGVVGGFVGGSGLIGGEPLQALAAFVACFALVLPGLVELRAQALPEGRRRELLGLGLATFAGWLGCTLACLQLLYVLALYAPAGSLQAAWDAVHDGLAPALVAGAFPGWSLGCAALARLRPDLPRASVIVFLGSFALGALIAIPLAAALPGTPYPFLAWGLWIVFALCGVGGGATLPLLYGLADRWELRWFPADAQALRQGLA